METDIRQPLNYSFKRNQCHVDEHDPYCCKVNIQRRDKKPNRSRYSRTYSIEVRFLFLKVGGAVSGTAVDTKHKVSLILESGLEIPGLLNFTHHCKEILDKME